MLTARLPAVITTLVATLVTAAPLHADEIRVAVASNFRHAIEDLAPRFEKATGHEVTLIFGSTGKHFAQIENGAPFDVYLAADELRPRMLEEDELAVSGSRFVYAIGKLVLWSAERDAPVDRDRLLAGDYRFLAIANPTLAPYGRAARQAMQSLGVWTSAFPRIVRGENVAQAYQYVVTGNADLGLVALSQIRIPGSGHSGSHWELPGTLYEPIRQQAALLNDTPATRAFSDFLRSEEAATVIRSYGYELP
jgi:molybdate transport system substrate-binding protein